jgi:hypothetical protein
MFGEMLTCGSVWRAPERSRRAGEPAQPNTHHCREDSECSSRDWYAGVLWSLQARS